jgi:poly(A) polymerase
MDARSFALDVVRTLRGAGYQALFAGGCVRDELLGLTPNDYDIATDATPDQVRPLFRRTIEIGASFGVVEVIGPRVGGEHLTTEVATFRTESSYSDGRRPDSVRFSTPEEDAARRDFTINGMFLDPLAGQVIDYVGGQADLHARTLRAIGDARARFAEDKLRLLRAVRVAARFDLTIEPATATAIRGMARQVTVVSAERIADELRKMLVHSARARALALLMDFGLVDPLLPEVTAMCGVPQGLPDAPQGDLWQHTLAVVAKLKPDVSFTLAMAALLHDIGKPRTLGRTPDRWTFHGHEHVGQRLADEIGRRLRLSNYDRERIAWLVEKHQFLCDAPRMRPSKLKTTLAHPGARELLDLHRADAEAWGNSTAHIEFCEARLREWPPEALDPPPLVTGDDLIAAGLAPGKRFKELLDAVREAQLDGTVHTKEEALALLRGMPDS